MAVTNQNSSQAAAVLGGRKLAAYKDQSTVMFQIFNHTQSGAGDAASTVRLFKVPPGIYRFHRALSAIFFSAFGASRLVDIGWEAYVDKDGTAVTASANGLNDNIDVAAAGTAVIGLAIAVGYKDFESRDGVWITATVAGGTIPDLATIDGVVALGSNT